MQVTVIADDLTGAADTGACFAGRGLTTLVSLHPDHIADADVVVVSSNSRELAANDATEYLGRIGAQIRSLGADSGWVYKKIDSTLRGNPDIELAALMDALDTHQALIAPAFPNQSRTTIGGRQLVDGKLLSETSFGNEVPTSELSRLFRQSARGRDSRLIDLNNIRQGHAAVADIFDERPGLFIADAETESDLRILARAAVSSGIRMLCGSAGLARALQECAELRPEFPSPNIPELVSGATLIVAGSRHQKTMEQIEYCGDAGIPIVRLPRSIPFTTEECDRIVAETVGKLSSHPTVVLTPVGVQTEAEPKRIAQYLGQITKSSVQSRMIGGLVVTGGQTALSVCSALDARTLWLQGEIGPGVAWGRLINGQRPGLLIATKAGGFGTPQTLLEASAFLLNGVGI